MKNAHPMKAFIRSPRLAWIAAAALALALAACQTPKTTATETLIDHVYLADADVSLVFDVVSFVQRTNENGLLESQFQARNKSDRPKTLYYQAQWFDIDKFKLGAARWQSELVQPGETAVVNVLARNPKAVYADLFLKL